MANNKPVSVRTRFEVFKRDQFTCQYCGGKPPAVVLEIDHIIPRSSDGDNSQTNLLTSCWSCNRGKSNVSLDSVPDTVAQRMERQKEAARQVAEFNEFLKEQECEVARAVTRLDIHWCEQFGAKQNQVIMLEPALRTLRMFLERLAEQQIVQCMDIALAKFPCVDFRADPSAWKYFCGVCWKKIKSGK